MQNSSTSFLFIVFLLFFNGLIAHAQQPGSLDTTFNSIGSFDGAINSLAQQADGKLIVAGNFKTHRFTAINKIARLNLDGSIDASFHTGIGADNAIHAIIVQPDGKIIVGGSFINYNSAAVNYTTRLNADGSKDNTFTTGTAANDTIICMALQPDGKILIGGAFTQFNGTAYNRIVRLNADGSLDASFLPGTAANSAINTIVLQSDGKILTGGDFTLFNSVSQHYITRLNADGSMDTGFTIGTGATNPVNAIALQSDNKIIIAGDFTGYSSSLQNGIVRLQTDGTVDHTFSSGSGPAYRSINSVLIQSDGKIMAGGAFTSFNGTIKNYIVRMNADGTLDNSFSTGFGFDNAVNTILEQADGKFLIGGAFFLLDSLNTTSLARINADGSSDATFNYESGPNERLVAIAVQNDQNILVGGYFNRYNGITCNYIARLTPDGDLDPTFSASGTGANNDVKTIVVQQDNKILIGGGFTMYNGTSRHAIARLNADGSLDNSFDPGTGANDYIDQILIQLDGKILICGYFNAFNGVTKNRIARLNTDGTIDNTFITSTSGANATVSLMLLQPDGKIVISGQFTSFNSVIRKGLARLNTDGTLDTSFDPGTGVTGGTMYSLLLLSSGKILCGGGFETYNGTSAIGIMRLNTDGSLDNSFSSGTGVNSGIGVRSFAVQEDSLIIAAGAFTQYNSINRNGVVRIKEDGSIDSSFVNTIDPIEINVNAVALMANGKIMIGGTQKRYGVGSVNYVCRIYGATETVVTATTTADEDQATNALNFYPNPASHFALVEMPVDMQGGKLMIYTLQGQEKYQVQLDSANTKIDLQHFAQGIYLYEYSNASKGLIKGKFIVQ
ncbi:MAG: hypothetical protein JWO58_1159 [Chitinophagaceae bacterium]|nr:hypothetical protein [Chitinophagaceae bacterium]